MGNFFSLDACSGPMWLWTFLGGTREKNTLYIPLCIMDGDFFNMFAFLWSVVQYQSKSLHLGLQGKHLSGRTRACKVKPSIWFCHLLKKDTHCIHCPWKFWVKRWQETEKEFCKDELRLRPLRSKDSWTEINFRCELHFSLVRTVHSISISHLDAHSIPRSQSHWCTTNSWCTDASWVISGFWFCEI